MGCIFLALTLASSLLLYSLLRAIRVNFASRTLPPAPPGLPFLGNVLQLPKQLLFQKLCKWHTELGGLYTFDALGQKIVVIGDAHIAADILDRLGPYTTSRPVYTMPTLLMTRNMSFGLAQYGDTWRLHRRICHENLNSRTLESYKVIQERGATELVRRFATSQPENAIPDAFRLFSGTTIWRALYGESTEGPSLDARISTMSSLLGAVFLMMTPTATLVNLVPALLHLPRSINPWKQWGDSFYDMTLKFGLDCVREGAKNEDASFVNSCLKAKQRGGDEVTEGDIAFTTMSVFGAAVETTAFTLSFFLQAMILYPDVCKKAQKAIDAIADNRPPSFEDKEHLPYVDALIREVLRWRPVAPLAVPHLANEAFDYGEYHIPKGTFIFPNLWAMNHNPEVYEDPETFRPERFLDEEGRVKTNPSPDYHDDYLAFGHGRRICPGRDFARNSMFITITYLLWAFDFCRAVNDEGKEVVPDADSFEDENILIYPTPFPFTLKPRRSLEAFFPVKEI